MRDVSTLQPWDIQPGESAKAYEAFAVYKAMGKDRSLEKVSRTVPRRLPTVKDWSARFNWVERARAFDVDAARLAAPKALTDHARVLARHARYGRLMAYKGARRIQSMKPRDLAPSDAAAFVVKGVATERQALAIPDRAPVDEDGKAVPVVAIIKIGTDEL